jgi:hypothetical protein
MNVVTQSIVSFNYNSDVHSGEERYLERVYSIFFYHTPHNETASNTVQNFVARDTCFVNWTSGVQTNMQHDIQPYPNPVSNFLYLATVCESERFNAYEIYNLSGLKVAEGRFSDHSYTIPVDILRSGMYLLRIKNESNAHNFKFIKN